MRRVWVCLALIGIMLLSAAPAFAGSKVGTCPENKATETAWQLRTVQSLFDEGLITASGAPSVDQNENGLTCIKFSPGVGQVGIPTIRDDSVGPQSS
jgi:type II secretory pathway pseudopilin PulG